MTIPSKILIVDDKPENLTALKRTLEDLEIDILTVTSGDEALKKILHHQFALLILDVMMPEMDGYELAELIRSQNETKHIPLIFLTAMDKSKKTVFKGYRTGAVDFLFKPVEEEILRNKINTFIELDQQKKELQRSNRDLEVFATMASHDLKSPLRNIKNLGGFLRNDYESLIDEEGNDYIDKIEEQTTRMTHMINGFLQYARLTKSAKPLQLINLNEIIQTVIVDLETSFKETKGAIHCEDLPTVKGESVLLSSLFQNIISNSLKFHRSEVPPIIKIQSQSPNEKFWEIIIEDNGIGFIQEEANKIFLPLKRLVSKDRYEGSGIGLATCKKIIDYHKGEITCRSQPGKGSTFIVSIPKLET
jgi:two-component system, sensor histidine kinase and response regulator